MTSVRDLKLMHGKKQSVTSWDMDVPSRRGSKLPGVAQGDWSTLSGVRGAPGEVGGADLGQVMQGTIRTGLIPGVNQDQLQLVLGSGLLSK